MTPSKGPLPLTPITMAILLALADQDRHGYDLMKEIERQTRGVLRPGTGSLYAALQRLMDEGLIADVPSSGDPDEDKRRKYYQLIEGGREIVRAEAQRMLEVLQIVRKKKLMPTPTLAGESEGRP